MGTSLWNTKPWYPQREYNNQGVPEYFSQSAESAIPLGTHEYPKWIKKMLGYRNRKFTCYVKCLLKLRSNWITVAYKTANGMFQLKNLKDLRGFVFFFD